MEYVAGIDLGGTNIAGGIVGEDGEIVISRSIKTRVSRGPEKIIDSIGDFTLELAEESGKTLSGVGIGSPGPLDRKNGKICDSPNLPGWDQIPIVSSLEEKTGLKCFLENDANAACLGEKLFGAGKEYDPIVHLTLGTGIGGGLFINGELFIGADGAGAELGHMTIDMDGYMCGCGTQGCLEAYCSDTGIRTQIEMGIGNFPDSILKNYNITNINFKLIEEASLQSDPFALEIFERVVTGLGVGIGNFVNIFNPQAVILSGGMIKAGEKFIKRIEAIVHERAFDILVENLKILPSTLGDNTGVLGAAACAITRK